MDKCRCPKSANLSSNGPSCIQTISKIYEHGLHQELEQLLAEDSNCTITSHRTCVACYTSPKSTKRILKKKKVTLVLKNWKTTKKKRKCPLFFHTNFCILCGEWCNIQKDCKHPGRWQKAFLCRTVSDVDLKQEGQDCPGFAHLNFWDYHSHFLFKEELREFLYVCTVQVAPLH